MIDLLHGPDPKITDPSPVRWRECCAVSFVVFAVLLWLARDLAFVSDESVVIEQWVGCSRWFAELFTRPSLELFSESTLDREWKFSRGHPNPHGPAATLVSGSGHALTEWILPPPLSYRIGPIALFSIAAGCTYCLVRRRWSRSSSLLAIGLLSFQPAHVPHLCYALTDGPLFSFALLTLFFFARWQLTRRTTQHLLFGVMLGLAFATKFTGFLLVVPYGLHLLWRRSFRDLAGLGLATMIALAVLVFVNVGWWPNPLPAVRTYFAVHLGRSQSFLVPTQFLGTRYEFALPWYNTLVWTAVATPVATLALGLVGVVATLRRRRDSVEVLLVGHWALFLLIRALPNAPGHDGIRLILVAFGCFSLLAGYGFETVAQAIHPGRLQRWLAACLFALALGESVVATARYHPQELSYYSPLIGGLPGAEKLGFEPTYYFAALDGEAIEWLNRNTADGQWILFGPVKAIEYLSRWGYLESPYQQGTYMSAVPQWLVVEHRPGLYEAYHHWLFEHGQPVFQRRLFGVPLLSVYPGDQALRAARQTNKG